MHFKMSKINTGRLISRILRLFFLSTLGLSNLSCENDTQSIARITNEDNAPIEIIRNLETLYSDSGIVKVKVKAPLLEKLLIPKPVTRLPAGIEIEFYDNHLKVISHLTAKNAVHYDKEGKWIATNDVVVINEKKEQLNTEKLIWDEKTGKLTSDVLVKITTAEEVIIGKGFEADQNFNQYKIFQPQGQFTIKK